MQKVQAIVASVQSTAFAYVESACGHFVKAQTQVVDKVQSVCRGVQTHAKAAIAKATVVVDNMQSQAFLVLSNAKSVGKEAVENATWAYTDPKAAARAAKSRAVDAAERACDVARDRTVQTTAASAAGGAVAMGTSGAAAGFVGGATIGAAMGVPAALFTFGMSIPIGAAVGSAAGFCTGAAVGGGVGLVGGGAAGYGVYTKKDKLRNRMVESWANLKHGAGSATSRTCESAADLRSRIVGRVSGKA
jgi:hypothetical protein